MINDSDQRLKSATINVLTSPSDFVRLRPILGSTRLVRFKICLKDLKFRKFGIDSARFNRLSYVWHEHQVLNRFGCRFDSRVKLNLKQENFKI